MSKLIAISDGHELTTAGKRTPPIPELDGRVILENEFNKAVALLLEDELIRCGFSVINVADTDNDSYQDRAHRANEANADIFVAIHFNAYDGEFSDYDPEGIEVYHYYNSVEGKKLATCIYDHLIGGTDQVGRGVKEAGFYVIKYTDMPAVLSENGYMDNKREAVLMIDKDFQLEVAQEHAKGICDYFGEEYIPADDSLSIDDINNIINRITSSSEDWVEGTASLMELANYESDFGDLEIFKYVYLLYEKLIKYNL